MFYWAKRASANRCPSASRTRSLGHLASSLRLPPPHPTRRGMSRGGYAEAYDPRVSGRVSLSQFDRRCANLLSSNMTRAPAPAGLPLHGESQHRHVSATRPRPRPRRLEVGRRGHPAREPRMALCPRRLLALDSHGRRPRDGRSSLGSMGTLLGSVKDSEAETSELPPSPPLGPSGRERLAGSDARGSRRLDPLSCTNVPRKGHSRGGSQPWTDRWVSPLSLFLFSASSSIS